MDDFNVDKTLKNDQDTADTVKNAVDEEIIENNNEGTADRTEDDGSENVISLTDKGVTLNGVSSELGNAKGMDDVAAAIKDAANRQRAALEELPDGTYKKNSMMPIIVSVILCLTTLIFCATCFFGVKMLIDDEKDDPTSDFGTLDDIILGESTTGSSNKEDEKDLVDKDNVTADDISVEWREDVTFPQNATINKSSPLRADADGDGYADAAYDNSGNILTSADKNVYPVATVTNMVINSVVEISVGTSGAGSGVIISKEGYIVTNNHVVEGADNISVRLTDGTVYAAYLVGRDENTDIAVIWIDPGERQLTVAPLGCSYDLVVGEEIIAIGNPLGTLGGTVTDGIISATERNISIDGNAMKLLQISSPINPGNSGGGLFNRAGQLVGIVNAKCIVSGVEGLGFAIPVDTAYSVITELIEYGYIRGQVDMKITVMDITSTMDAMRYFGSTYIGAYVYAADAESGLLQGDLIVSVDGTAVTSEKDIYNIADKKKIGDTVTLKIYRHSTKAELDVEITLEEYIPDYLIKVEK